MDPSSFSRKRGHFCTLGDASASSSPSLSFQQTEIKQNIGVTRMFVLSPRSTIILDSDVPENDAYFVKIFILNKNIPKIEDITVYYIPLTSDPPLNVSKDWERIGVEKEGRSVEGKERQIYDAKMFLSEEIVFHNGFEFVVMAKVDNELLRWPVSYSHVVTVI